MRFLTFFILTIVFTSCQNSISNEYNLKVYYSTGELMILADTIGNRLDGDIKYYDRTGQLISSQTWIKGHDINDLESYDDNLINFYTEIIDLQWDSVFYVDSYHELEIYNFPKHILILASTNGKIRLDDNKWILTPEFSSKKLKLNLNTVYNGQYRDIKTIEKIVRSRK